MRAVIRHSTALAVQPDVPEPTPRPGEALIAPTRVAIASPDIAVALGHTPFSGVVGHEFVGIVQRVEPLPGREDQQKLVGRRVVGNPTISCGQCDLCRGGIGQHCQRRQHIGLVGRDGCFADRLTLPIHNLVEVPKNLHDDQAVFASAVAAAVHAAQMLRIEGKPYVTVLGDGVMGLLCAQVMARLNASVRLLGNQPAKFMLCERWGIKHRHVAEVGRRMDQDLVVDCTGHAEGLELALQLVRPRGKVLLKAGPMSIPPRPHASAPAPSTGPSTTLRSPDLTLAAVNEIEIIGSGPGRIAEGIAALAKNTVEVLSMVSARFKLSDAQAAFKLAMLPEAVKVLLEVGDARK